MSKIWDAIIVGGGLAGCATAIGLVGRDWSVLLLEQKRYPANKLCGEFLSVEAASYFVRLGVLDQIRNSGATSISQYRITSVSNYEISGDLPGTALGVSREKLDLILMNRARDLGADCREGSHVSEISGSLASGFAVSASGETHRARCVIGAYGKRSSIDKSTARRIHRERPFDAFKMHYVGVHAPSTIELFSFPGGYVGISPVEDGLVNACFIVRRDSSALRDGNAPDYIKNAAKMNQSLALRLNGLSPVGKMIAISSIPFQTKGTFHNDICMVGDSAGMIAPLCGDGMSMAMRSGQIAMEAAADFLSGQSSKTQFIRAYSSRWNREFRMRLAVGRVLQQVSVYPSVADFAIRLCSAAPNIARCLIGSTRGKPISQIG